MIDGWLSYIRNWFPSQPYKYESGRKRRSSNNLPEFSSPKYRKVLSNMSNLEDDFQSPRRRSVRVSQCTPPTIIIDDHGGDDDYRRITKSSIRNKLFSNDVSITDEVKGIAEKKSAAKEAGFSYITHFNADRTPITQRFGGSTPNSKSKSGCWNSSLLRRNKTHDISRPYRNSKMHPGVSSPSLDYSIRLDDKRKYNQLLENLAMNGSMNNSSIYGTPIGKLYGPNRSKTLVELARAHSSPTTVVDLTDDATPKPKLSTKETVIKILDNFDNDVAVIEDSDSDIEVLPTPPSPKPDIKVDPVNSLRKVVNTSQHSKPQWLDDITKKHEHYLKGKTKEIAAYSENSSTLGEINRDLLIKNLTRKIQDSLAIKDAVLPVIEIEEEPELPELTSEHLKIIKRAFSGNPNEVLSKKFNLNITRRDIDTLSGLNWLNDNVINFYMSLIMERSEQTSKFPKCYCTNTFFYQKLCSTGPESLRRWTRRVDIFSFEILCVPIHLGVHWCMAIINLKEKSIRYYDSMGKPNNHCLAALRGYLEYEHKDKKGTEYSTKDFVLENAKNVPMQMNGSDCGMFACTFAEFASRKAKFCFQQEDMPYLRQKMVVEIIMGELLIN